MAPTREGLFCDLRHSKNIPEKLVDVSDWVYNTAIAKGNKMETWTRRTYVCDSSICDAWLEITTKDSLGSRTTVMCPCGSMPNLVSEVPATIIPTNEKEQQVETTYNPTQTIELRKFTGTEYVNVQYDANQLEEVLRKVNLIEQRIAHQEKQIGQIIDNLTAEGWYSDSVDKEDVLKDLCTILEHNPQQELSWTITVTVSGSTMVNLEDVSDFDIRYHLQDELSIDSNDFDTKVDSFDIYDVDSQDWL